jgi:hypothetical protein
MHHHRFDLMAFGLPRWPAYALLRTALFMPRWLPARAIRNSYESGGGENYLRHELHMMPLRSVMLSCVATPSLRSRIGDPAVVE